MVNSHFLFGAVTYITHAICTTTHWNYSQVMYQSISTTTHWTFSRVKYQSIGTTTHWKFSRVKYQSIGTTTYWKFSRVMYQSISTTTHWKFSRVMYDIYARAIYFLFFDQFIMIIITFIIITFITLSIIIIRPKGRIMLWYKLSVRPLANSCEHNSSYSFQWMILKHFRIVTHGT